MNLFVENDPDIYVGIFRTPNTGKHGFKAVFYAKYEWGTTTWIIANDNIKMLLNALTP